MPALRDEGGDGSDSEPAWLKKFSSPAVGRAAAAVASSSSSEDANEAAQTIETATKTNTETQSDARAKDESIAPTTKPTTVKPAPAPPPPPPPPRDGSSTSSSTRVDLVATANLGGKSKVLFEIEGSGEAIDLDGDTGAVGRWLAESSRALKVDMKGVMYNARVVPAAGSIVVVAVNGDVAKIESVHREFIQLREDPNACGGVQNLGVGSLFDRDDDDDDEDEDAPAPRASIGAAKRKRSTDAAGGAKKRKQSTARAKPKPKPRAKSKK